MRPISRTRLAAAATTIAVIFASFVAASPAAAATLPVIVSAPTGDITVWEGETIPLSAVVTGDPEPSVHWMVHRSGGWYQIAVAPSINLTVNLGGTFRVTAQNSAGSVDSAEFHIIANHPAPPTVTQSPTSTTVVEGQDAVFVAAGSTPPTPTVQWQQSSDSGQTWTNVAGATNPTYTRAAVTLADDGLRFRAQFSNAGGTNSSSSGLLTVLRADVPPTVTTQPVSNEIYYGGTAYFLVAADAVPAATVKWESSTDGDTWSTIPGEEGTVLQLDDVTEPLQVRAVFTNSVGSVTTDAASVTFYGPDEPFIYTDPEDTSVDVGDDATFDVTVVGLPAPTYQWYIQRPGGQWEPLDGETGSSLTLGAITAADDQIEVYVEVSNSYGTVTSDEATLSVNESAPVVTLQPVDTYPDNAGNYSFTAEATGFPVPTIAWYKLVAGSWVLIPGENDTTLSGLTDSAGEYQAVFTNALDSAGSNVAHALPATVPTVDWVSADTVVNSGESATFEVSTTGFPAPTIRWERIVDNHSVLIPGATGTTYTTDPLEWADSGYAIRAVVTNIGGTSSLTQKTVTVLPESPTIVTDPADVTAEAGGDATFTIVVDGDPVPDIQWQVAAPGTDAWTDVPGATGTTFTIHDVTAADDGTRVRAVLTGQDPGPASRVQLLAAVQLTSAVATLSVTAAPPVDPASPGTGLASTGVDASGPLFGALLLLALGALAFARRRQSVEN